MNKRFTFPAVALAAAALVVLTQLSVFAQEDAKAKEKVTIKQVMKEAHKDGLLPKVLKDEATPEEKLKLLDLYVSLAENEPPQGDAKAWKERTSAIVLSVAKVVVKREGAEAELKKSADCAACHGDFKPPAE